MVARSGNSKNKRIINRLGTQKIVKNEIMENKIIKNETIVNESDTMIAIKGAKNFFESTSKKLMESLKNANSVREMNEMMVNVKRCIEISKKINDMIKTYKE